MVVVPRRHARRRLHEHRLRLHPRRDPVAALRRRRHIGGYSEADAITYTWLTQALIMMIAIWNWVDLATRIQTGDIVTDLQRPIDLQAAYLARTMGRAVYQLLARGSRRSSSARSSSTSSSPTSIASRGSRSR